MTKIEKLIHLFDDLGAVTANEIRAIGFSRPRKAVADLRKKIKAAGASKVWRIDYSADYKDYELIRLA